MIINGLKFEKLQLFSLSCTPEDISMYCFICLYVAKKKTSPNMFNLIQNSSRLNVYDAVTL